MIKTLLTATILATLVACQPAQAEQVSCKDISQLAETIMTARQFGVPMSKMMDGSGELEIAKTMIVQAYEKPRYGTKQFQQRKIADFRDEWYLACVKAE